jgi:hypothetical protein
MQGVGTKVDTVDPKLLGQNNAPGRQYFKKKHAPLLTRTVVVRYLGYDRSKQWNYGLH